jgi:hypothetical protein
VTKSLHDYRGEYRAALRRERKATRRWTSLWNDGGIHAPGEQAAFDEMDRCGDAAGAKFDALDDALSDRYGGWVPEGSL